MLEFFTTNVCVSPIDFILICAGVEIGFAVLSMLYKYTAHFFINFKKDLK